MSAEATPYVVESSTNGKALPPGPDLHLVQPELLVSEEIDRSTEIFRLERDENTFEVHVESDLTLEDYRQITHPDDWNLLLEQAKPLEGKTVAFLNPTMTGGGVAMLRPPAVHLLRQLGVDAHWYVMDDCKDEFANSPIKPFEVTKKMHNISQRREQPGERLTEEEKAIHGHWADLNAAVLEQQPIIQNADIIVYDDPQPAPMIHQLQQVNPTAKLVWRNHIDTDRELMANPHTPQGEVASYILHELGVNKVDAAIMHPVEQFVHDELSDRTFFAPATTEPHDDLNRELSPDEIEAGFNFINAEIEEKNELLREVGRFEDIQPSMDPHKRRITLIARFDESKGMDKAMELGVQTRQKMRAFGIPEANLPEVVIVGNGSIDDPSGPKMYEKMLELRRTTYAAEADGIVIMRLKHNYTAMNALMHKSDVITQTSEAEGWETRVSDAIEHGVPVVVSNRGGIQQQVVEGESGFVLDFDKPDYDLGRGSDIIMDLLVDGQYYEAMRKSTLRQAETFNRREITTTANVTRFLRVFNHVLSGNPARADRTWMIRDLVAQEQAQALQTRRALGAMVL